MKLGQDGEARRPETVFLRIALLAIFAVLVGIVVLPMGSAHKAGWWASICGALGVARTAPPPPADYGSLSKSGSLVSWDSSTDTLVAAGSFTRGRAISEAGCVACHAAGPRAADPTIPDLDGIGRRAVYKELADFRSGRRIAPVMNAVAQGLSDGEASDVAAFYAQSGGPAARMRATSDTDSGRRDPVIKLVYQGDPARGIAPCAACHGPDGRVEAAPTLFGQSEPYLAAQLHAFHTGMRHNDNLAQMRMPAHGLDDREIGKLAAYLGPTGRLPGP